MKWLKRSAVRRLNVIADFGHVDVESLHRIEFNGQDRSAAESWLRRMCRGGWLQSAKLDERRVYYRLTAKAVVYLKRICRQRVSRAATRPLSANRKFEKHALLQYCTAEGAPKRQAFRPSHDAGRFSDIAAHIADGKADPLRHKLFYREDELIGYFVADRGQERLVQSRVRPKMYALFRWQSFRELAEQKVIRLTIATMTDTRARELRRDVEENPPPVAWEIVVVPELIGLLPRKRSSNIS